MSTKNQIVGGVFQDIEGSVLSNGYLLFTLSQDAQANSNTSVASGKVFKVPLDVNGTVASSPSILIWPNDVLSPASTFYLVSGYTSSGQLVWGPNPQRILSSPSPFNIGAWIPGMF